MKNIISGALRLQSPTEVTDVSEQHSASIFRIEEETNTEISRRRPARLTVQLRRVTIHFCEMLGSSEMQSYNPEVHILQIPIQFVQPFKIQSEEACGATQVLMERVRSRQGRS
jgi:hypothetical protein